METIEILIIFSLILGLTNWFILYKNNKYDDNVLDKLNNYINLKIDEDKKNKLDLNIVKNDILLPERENIINYPIREFSDNYITSKIGEDKKYKLDLNIVENDIIPPERKYMINYPTRGFPDNYQLLGILLGQNIAYKLYGRQKYRGSDLYDYYIYAVKSDVKIPLDINKEIFDNQEIIVMNEKLKVKLYPYDIKYVI
jgi:hypothetical protein